DGRRSVESPEFQKPAVPPGISEGCPVSISLCYSERLGALRRKPCGRAGPRSSHGKNRSDSVSCDRHTVVLHKRRGNTRVRTGPADYVAGHAALPPKFACSYW